MVSMNRSSTHLNPESGLVRHCGIILERPRIPTFEVLEAFRDPVGDGKPTASPLSKEDLPWLEGVHPRALSGEVGSLLDVDAPTPAAVGTPGEAVVVGGHCGVFELVSPLPTRALYISYPECNSCETISVW